MGGIGSGRKPIPLRMWFWMRVEIMEGGCVEWRGARESGGYGIVRADNDGQRKRMRLAHRVAYELARGPIPKGMLVCHTCDNRICVNPAHLWLGTHRDNNLDAVRKHRRPTTYRKRGKKITAEGVAKARAEYAAGIRLRLIAEKYGMTYSGMRAIVLRHVWKHIVP